MEASTSLSPVFLLTGGGSGIGLVVLTMLLEKPDTRIQVLTLEPTAELSAVEQKYGQSRLRITYGDACQEPVVTQAVDSTTANFQYMTHLISCIGTILPVQAIRDVPLKSHRKIFDINYFSVVDLVQKCLPKLKSAPIRPKVIIVTSGVDIDIEYRGWSGYCTSKAALSRFTHLLAHEEKDIDVYGVLPRVTKSPIVDKILAGAYDDIMFPKEKEKFRLWEKEGKIEPTEYIAEAIVKCAEGAIKRDSPEVERERCGALFVSSLYQPASR